MSDPALNLFGIIKDYMGKAPVDVEELVKTLGIDLHYAYLDPDISGQIERVAEDKYRITVNAEDAKTRQRFTIAHELGHYLYHRPVIGDGVDDDRAYRSTQAGKYHNLNIGPREEAEANRFAAALLMPDTVIKSLREEKLSPAQMAEKLGVSRQALEIRLTSAG